MPQPEVTQANDRHQIRAAKTRLASRERRFMDALRAVLNTPQGRLIFGERELGLLARAGVYKSIWARDASIHYNAGKQDFGHELLALLTQADEMSYLRMEAEMRALAKRDSGETEAAHLPSTDDEKDVL